MWRCVVGYFPTFQKYQDFSKRQEVSSDTVSRPKILESPEEQKMHYYFVRFLVLKGANINSDVMRCEAMFCRNVRNYQVAQ